MKSLLGVVALLAAACFSLPANGQDAAPAQPDSQTPASEWKYSKWSNPMTGVAFDQFTLEGKYVAPPSHAVGEGPSLVVHCSDGKFGSGEFHVGAVVQREPGAHSFKGIPQAKVQMRFDERTKLDDDWWEISNNGRTLFFDRTQLTKLMTARLLGHPGDPNDLVHRLILGVVEFEQDRVVMQFDMPHDTARMVAACGLEWGKGKKK